MVFPIAVDAESAGFVGGDNAIAAVDSIEVSYANIGFFEIGSHVCRQACFLWSGSVKDEGRRRWPNSQTRNPISFMPAGGQSVSGLGHLPCWHRELKGSRRRGSIKGRSSLR